MTIHSFQHEAMNTLFSIRFACTDEHYARSASRAVFAEIDRLESLLSCFIESSDISRLNNRPGSRVPVQVETYECLAIAEQVRQLTSGAFDVAFSSPQRSVHSFALADGACVDVDAAGIEIDLGGIGKGYALDKCAELLDDWELTAALLSAGGSTLLALDPPPETSGWSAHLPNAELSGLELEQIALSASGTGVQGDHIMDPRTGETARRCDRIWSLAPTAAFADAFSTAFMVMEDAEIKATCDRIKEVRVIFGKDGLPESQGTRC